MDAGIALAVPHKASCTNCPIPEPLTIGIQVDWSDKSCCLYFEDSAGVAWIREVSGKLRKASDEEVTSVLRLHGIPVEEETSGE